MTDKNGTRANVDGHTWSHLPRIAGRLFNQPHAITPSKLHAILWALRDRLGEDVNMPTPEASGLDDERPQADGYDVVKGVAVVPVHGTLIQKGDALDAQSGLLGYDRLTSMIEAAEADPEADAILLDVDSGGGEVAGALDAADTISAVASRVPMAALANEHACSAAYLMASAAGRVWVTQGAAIGSIGVIMAHVDETQANAQRGIEVTELFAGAFKADGSPYHALGNAEQQRLQGFVDETYGMLVDKVASFRGLSPQAVRDTQAGIFLRQDRFDRNLADAQHTLSSAVKQLRSLRQQTPLTTRQSSNQRTKTMAKQAKRQGGACPVKAGENLASALNDAIQEQVTEDRTAQDVQDDMADAAGISSSTVDGILSGEINCPPLERLEGFAEVLDVSMSSLRDAAESDGCDYDTGGDSDATTRRSKPHSRAKGKAKAANPADVIALCNAAGTPELAESLVREQATMEQARARVNSVGTMQERCDAAVSASMVSRDKADELRAAAVKAGKTPDQLSADLMNVAVQQQSPDDAVESRILAGTQAGDPSRGWDQAAKKVAAMHHGTSNT